MIAPRRRDDAFGLSLGCALCGLLLLQPSANASDIADAAKRGNAASLRTLIGSADKAARQRAWPRWHDGAALGGASQRRRHGAPAARRGRRRELEQSVRHHATVVGRDEPQRRAGSPAARARRGRVSQAAERRDGAHGRRPLGRRQDDRAADRRRQRSERAGRHARRDGIDVGCRREPRRRRSRARRRRC